MGIDFEKLDREIGYQTEKEKDYSKIFGSTFKETGKFASGLFKDVFVEIPKSVGRAGTMPISMMYEGYKGLGGKKIKAGEAIQKFSPLPKTKMDYVERFADIALLAPPGTGTAIGKLTGLSKLTSKVGKATGLKTTKTQRLVKELLRETKKESTYARLGIKGSTKKMFKKLTKQEKDMFAPFVEGRTVPLTKPSSNFVKAVKSYQKSTEQQEINLLKGGFSKTQLAERQWLPMKISTKKGKEELQKMVVRDVNEAIKLRKPMEPLYYPIKVDTSKSVWKIGSPFRKRGTPSFKKKATGKGVISTKRINNPEVVVAARRTEEAMHNMHNSLIDKVVRRYGSKEAKEGLVELAPQGSFRFFKTEHGFAGVTKKVPKVYVKPEVRMEIDKYVAGRAEILKSLDKVFFPTIDTINSLFKIGVLPLRLAWSVVNVIGNVFLNSVGGVPPKAYINAMKPSYRKLMSKKARKKLIGSHFATQEAGAKGLLRKVESALYRPNQYLEDHSRWIHFVGKAEKFAKQRVKVLKATGKMPGQKQSLKPLLRESTDDLSDFIVGSKKTINKLFRKERQLEHRILKGKERQPFISAGEKGKKILRGKEEILARLRMDTGFGMSASRKAIKRGEISLIDEEKIIQSIPRNQIDNISKFMNSVADNLFDDVGISILKNGNKQGQFEYGKGLISLYKKTIVNNKGKFDRTTIHEMWHSLARALPKKDVIVFKKDYLKGVNKFSKKNKWFNEVFDKDNLKVIDEISDKKAQNLFKRFPEIKKYFSQNFQTKTWKMGFTDKTYRLKNVDEWFAENLTDKTFQNFAEMNQITKSIFAHSKNVFKKIIQHIQQLFGKNVAGRVYDDFINQRNVNILREGGLNANVVSLLKNKASPNILQQTSKMLPQRTEKEVIMGLMKNSKSIHKKSMKEVNHYLFDYSNLTPVEKEFLKRIFPFWSWTRNITRLGGTLAYEKPYMAAVAYQVYEAMKKQGLQEEDLPEGSEWMKGMIQTPLAMTKEGKIVLQSEFPDATPVYWSWKHLYPFYDIGRLSISSITPILKVPIERKAGKQVMNKEMKDFTAQYLKKGEEAPPIPKGLENLIKPTVKYGGITKGETLFAKPSILRHVGMQTSPFRLKEKLTKPYSTYSATGQPILDKQGKPKYPNSRTAALLQYFAAISLYARNLKEKEKK